MISFASDVICLRRRAQPTHFSHMAKEELIDAIVHNAPRPETYLKNPRQRAFVETIGKHYCHLLTMRIRLVLTNYQPCAGGQQLYATFLNPRSRPRSLIPLDLQHTKIPTLAPIHAPSNKLNGSYHPKRL